MDVRERFQRSRQHDGPRGVRSVTKHTLPFEFFTYVYNADSLSSALGNSAYSNSDAQDYLIYLKHLRDISLDLAPPPHITSKRYRLKGSVACVVGMFVISIFKWPKF
jgi:hypothetical protein